MNLLRSFFTIDDDWWSYTCIELDKTVTQVNHVYRHLVQAIHSFCSVYGVCLTPIRICAKIEHWVQSNPLVCKTLLVLYVK
jgi:hypothetical protein